MAEQLKLTKKDRISVWLRSTFLQGSWNYERMHLWLGWVYSSLGKKLAGWPGPKSCGEWS